MPAPAPRRTAATVLRGLTSLALLTTAIGALPILLAWATPTVWNAGSSGLRHLLDQQDSGGAFLLVLLLLAWAGWAHFTLSVLVELPAQLRGRAARRRRGLGLSQRAAATLIGSILVLLPATNALASSSSPAAAAPTNPSDSPYPAQRTTIGQQENASYRLYTVRDARPAESLWSIAEHELGNGERWHHIAELNEGSSMNDGSVFHADTFLQPGWQLRLPHRSPAAASEPRTVTVRPGDDLSSLAERHLGDATAWPKIFELNKGQPQPDGSHFTNPDLIHTGQQLKLPAPPSPSPPHSTPTPPTPHKTAPSTPPPPRKRSTLAPHPTSPPQSPTTDHHIGIWQITGIGSLLAAGLLATLGTKRILQHRRRKPGETIAVPDEPAHLEQVLSTTAEPASVTLLDTALRTLAHHATTAGTALPVLRGAQVTAHTVAILPEETTAAPVPPFNTGVDSWWILTDHDSLLPPDEARRIPAPYPGLVTLGTDADGTHLLVNLSQLPALLLDGSPEDIRQVARALAAEAATSSWSDHADILTIGLGHDVELAGLLPQGRLHTVPDLRAALRDLGAFLIEAHQNATDPDAAQPLPWMLICAAEIDPNHVMEFADALAAARNIPVTAILPTTPSEAYFPDAEHLDTSQEGPQPCPLLNTPIVLQRLNDQDFHTLLDTLRTAENPPRPANGDWKNVPAAPAPTAPSAATPSVHPATAPTSLADQVTSSPIPKSDTVFPALISALGGTRSVRLSLNPSQETIPPPAAQEDTTIPSPAQHPDQDLDDPTETPKIQVLGTLAVTGVQASGHGPKLAALAALIHFKPGRSAEELCEAMDPASPWSKNTLQARISELRKRLGTDPDGEPYLPRERTTGYRLSPAVRCDWDVFQLLAQQGLRKGPDTGLPDLEAALALVRGRPLNAGTLPWATSLYHEIIARITDTAHTIATWHRTGPRQDLDAARRAVATGLDADDTAELLYQDWILIEDAAGNRAGVLHAIDALQTVNRRLDIDLQPDTEAIISSIFGTGLSRT